MILFILLILLVLYFIVKNKNSNKKVPTNYKLFPSPERVVCSEGKCVRNYSDMCSNIPKEGYTKTQKKEGDLICEFTKVEFS